MATQHSQNEPQRGSTDAKNDKGIKTSPEKSGSPSKQAPPSSDTHSSTKKPSGH